MNIKVKIMALILSPQNWDIYYVHPLTKETILVNLKEI